MIMAVNSMVVSFIITMYYKLKWQVNSVIKDEFALSLINSSWFWQWSLCFIIAMHFNLKWQISSVIKDEFVLSLINSSTHHGFGN